MAKMGELKRAAQVLGVTSSTLRQQGWATASPRVFKRSWTIPLTG